MILWSLTFLYYQVMKKLLIVLFIFCSTTLLAQNKERGEEFIQTLLIEKDLEKAHTFFDENMKSQLPVPALEKTLDQLNTQIGTFKNIIEVNNVGELYHYYSEFSKLNLDINIAFGESGKIIGFFFQPHKEFASTPRMGKDLNIESKGIELKGTLLRADEFNEKQLVIFVHGSGPNDRDGTVYENKPFMQMAEELYHNGISSYRFDKRTLTDPNSLDKDFTVDDEVTNDVLNILNYFSNNEEFKDHEITLIGLSLGAYLLPRIANRSDQVSKLIMLAGNARPLEVILINQLEYINSLENNLENQKLLEETREKIAFLKSKKFNIKSSQEKLPLNLSAAYWKSLLEYDHLKEVKKISIPILVAQGERDYQVTMEDYGIWKKALKKNNNAIFKSYPESNHLFITGTGKSTPQEYRIKGDVDKGLIKDMINFIKSN